MNSTLLFVNICGCGALGGWKMKYRQRVIGEEFIRRWLLLLLLLLLAQLNECIVD